MGHVLRRRLVVKVLYCAPFYPTVSQNILCSCSVGEVFVSREEYVERPLLIRQVFVTRTGVAKAGELSKGRASITIEVGYSSKSYRCGIRTKVAYMWSAARVERRDAGVTYHLTRYLYLFVYSI